MDKSIKEAQDAAKLLSLIGRAEGDIKSIGKRLTVNGQWPEEIRTFLRWVRETRDNIEQSHPELTK